MAQVNVSELDKKAITAEKRNVELWGVLLGLSLWLAFYGIFYVSSLYSVWGRTLLHGAFYSNDPTLLLLFVTLPLSVAFAVASTMGAIKAARKLHSTRSFRIAAADSLDVFLWLNLTAGWIGLALRYAFYPLYQSVPILGLIVANLLAFLPPIIGFALILDFAMPKFWHLVFGYNYGYFQGKLLRNLKRSWRKGDLQRDFRKHLVGAAILVFSILVVLVVLVLMGLLK